jgi:hypothetical protein
MAEFLTITQEHQIHKHSKFYVSLISQNHIDLWYGVNTIITHTIRKESKTRN